MRKEGIARKGKREEWGMSNVVGNTIVYIVS
jgi:hypothetical protein